MLLDFMTAVKAEKVDKLLESIIESLNTLKDGIPINTMYVYYSHVAWMYRLVDNSDHPYICIKASIPPSQPAANDYKVFNFDNSVYRSKASFLDIHSHIYNAITDVPSRNDLRIEIVDSH